MEEKDKELEINETTEPSDVEETNDLIEHTVTEEKTVLEENKKNPKNNKKLFWIFLLVLVIALVVCAMFLLPKKEKESNTNTISGNKYKSEYRMSGNALEDFDLYFLKLENEEVNKVYSPLSIKYALEMLMEGADGDTEGQISAILGDYEARKYINSENMSFANALFIRDTFKDYVKQDYINKLKNTFDAEIVFDPFANADNLNNWVKNKTLNLLDNLVDDVSDLDFALVNALAIDMEWEERFIDQTTTPNHNTGAMYSHERKSNKDYQYFWYPIYELEKSTFSDIKEEISGMRIKGSFNNYDIVSELGEEKIKETVRNEYKKYLEGINVDDWEYETYFSDGKTDEVVNEYVEKFDYDKYVEEISKNYKHVAYNTDFSFYVDDYVKVFAKDLKEYNGTTLQYVGIMPTNVNLNAYISNTNASEINKLISNLKELKLENFKDGVVTEIDGYIPKFKFDYQLNLQKDLETLGVKDVFDIKKSNLSKLTQQSSYISSVAHKANIEFSQYGIKAAAATLGGGRGAGGSWDYYFEVPFEHIDLTFDRPYMFIIRDKTTGEVWFTGTVYEPLLWSQDETKEAL